VDEWSANASPPDQPTTSAEPGYQPPLPWRPPPSWESAPAPAWEPNRYQSRPPSLDRCSVAGLIFGILPTVPLGLIFGIAGIVRTSRRLRRGRPLAVIGLLLSALWLVVIAAGLAGWHGSSQYGVEQRNFSQPVGTQQNRILTPLTPGPVTPAAITPRDLQPGACFMLGQPGATYSISVLPCSKPHDAQFFAKIQLAYKPYPGADKTFDAALKLCKPVALSNLKGRADPAQVTAFYPTDVSWAIGDYSAYCILYDPQHGLVGDARSHH
jgi:hypothetical protein